VCSYDDLGRNHRNWNYKNKSTLPASRSENRYRNEIRDEIRIWFRFWFGGCPRRSKSNSAVLYWQRVREWERRREMKWYKNKVWGTKAKEVKKRCAWAWVWVRRTEDGRSGVRVYGVNSGRRIKRKKILSRPVVNRVVTSGERRERRSKTRKKKEERETIGNDNQSKNQWQFANDNVYV